MWLLNRKERLIWVPSFIGLILLSLSQLDLYLFKQGFLGVRTILSWELILFIAGLLSCIAVFIFGIACLFKKAWLLALQSFVSSVLFLVLFAIGGALGAAYIHAT